MAGPAQAAPVGVPYGGGGGGVVGWGNSGDGQTTPPAGAQAGVTALAAGQNHSLALRTDGSVIGWGGNNSGQATVPAAAQSDVRAISAFGNESLALRRSGEVVAWGDNSNGQATVPAAARTGVTAIASGSTYSLAVKDGGVIAWGSGTQGQTTVPAAASTGVATVTAGLSFALALKTDGTTVAWGGSTYEQTTIPTAARTNVTAVAAGFDHALALTTDGAVVAWGRGTFGQTTVPTAAKSNVVAVAANGNTSLALRSDGSVVAWGWDTFGQATVPATATSGIVAIAAGTFHSLALGVAFTDAAPPAGAYGSHYAYTFVAAPGTGAPVYSATGTLPPGLTLDPATGALTGTPTAAGSYDFTVRATRGSVGRDAPPSTVVVAPRPLTVAAGNAQRAYGEPDPEFTYDVTGLLDGDRLTTAPTCTVAAAHTDAGSYPITCTGADAGPNYTVTARPGTLAVGKALVTVTAANAVTTYGAPTPALGFTVSGLLDGDRLTTDPTCAVAGVHTAAGTYAVTCSGADAGPNYAIATTPGTLTVTPAPLVVTAESRTARYGDVSPVFGHTVAGLLGDDALAVEPDCGVTGPHTAAGSYDVTCHGADAGPNYAVSYRAGTFTVTRATVTITADGASRLSGEPDPAFGYTTDGLLDGDALATAPTCAVAGDHDEAGTYEILCAGADGGPNYDVAYATGTLTVTSRPLLVTADDRTVTYGTADPAFTWTVSSDDPLTTDPTCAVAGEHRHVGTYPVVCSGADAGPGHPVSYAAGTLTVTPAPLTVTAPNAAAVYGAETPELVAKVQGLLDGDQLVTAPTCRTDGAKDAGRHPITCDGADAGPDYDLTSVGGVLEITPATLAVTAENVTSVYGAGVPAPTATVTGLIGGDAASAPVCRTSGTHVGTYPVTCDGVDAGGNYAVEYHPGVHTIVPAPLTVTAANAVKVYGLADPAFGSTTAGLVGDDRLTTNPVCAVPADHTHAGSYAITCTGAVATADYTVTGRPGTLTVTKAPTALTAAPLIYSWLQPTATLTRPDTGAALAGLPVRFTDGDRTLCTATTNSSGRARCSRTFVLVPTLTASFAGTGDLTASSDQTTLF